VNKTAKSKVRNLLAAACRAGYAPGLVAGWRRCDSGVEESVSVGRASIFDPPRPLVEDHWFDLASLTKPLVVIPLVMLLARNDFLSLESRVATAIPELADKPIGDRRVRHLLTHTSGLPAWVPLYAITVSAGEGDVLRAFAGLDVSLVGRDVTYSCPGFILLGLMIERLTSTPLDLLFTRLVLEPLSLTDDLAFRPAPSRRIAAGARSPGAESELLRERGLDPADIPPTSPLLPDDGNARFLDGVAGNAGLFGTAHGVLSLACALMTPGVLLDDDEIRQTVRNHTPGCGQARGLGWQLASTPGCSAGTALGSSAFGHTGFTGTSLWVDPVRKVAMTLLTNRVHPGHRATDLHPLRRRFHQIIVDQLG
jgi:CubicO group peptidase (beta-lactamase class C family)